MKLDELLLDWYDVQRRDLPWRGTRDPYRIWLSEIMLQQTRTETVARYYARFLERFPTVADLAHADEDEVLKLWEGLGYYSRARNLHAAAKRVALDFGGRFPSDSASLRALPGVGPYAANAIASIAFDECAPALDGNQARVLSRVLAWERPLKTPFDLEARAREMMSRSRPGDYNQALMDLGASVCTPRRPDCSFCPIAACCKARELGDPESFPRKQPPIARREVTLTIVVARCPGGIAVRRRPARGLLGGLYEFLSLDGHPSLSEIPARLASEGLPGAHLIAPLPDAKHVFTHLVWRMKGAAIDLPAPPQGFTVASDLSALAFPSALRVYRACAESLLETIESGEPE